MKMEFMEYRMALLALRQIDSDMRYHWKGSRLEVQYALEANLPTDWQFVWVPSNLSGKPSIRQICVIRVVAITNEGSVTLEFFYNAPDRIGGEIISRDGRATWEDSIDTFLDRLIKIAPKDNDELVGRMLASLK